MTSHTFYTRPRAVVALALLCCLLWGSSYPAIKSGYALFGIAQGDVATKLVFAGWRFLFAGVVVLAIARMGGKAIFDVPRNQWRPVAVLGLAQTTLQYVFFYIGLAHTTGVKSSILNATGTFFSVMLAHWLHRDDRASKAKALGCLIGFAGVMVVNLGAGPLDFEFSLLGEGFVVIAAFVLAAASFYGRGVSQQMDSVVMTGWQLTVGGAALLALGALGGGALSGWSPASASLLAYLAALSAVAISLWSVLLKHNRVSFVTAFNFMVPVFGALLSALFLDEQILEWKNAVALAMVCGGIWLVTVDPGRR